MENQEAEKGENQVSKEEERMEGNCIFVFQITHEGGERLVCRRAASGLFNSCTAFTSRRLFDSV